MPDLDSALRVDAEAWRAETDAAYVGHRDWAPTPQQRSHLLPAIAAAVLVAIIAIGAAIAVSRSHDHRVAPTALTLTLPTAPVTVDPLTGMTGLGGPDPSSATDVRVVPGLAGPGIVSTRWQFLAVKDSGRTLIVSYNIGGSCDNAVGFRVQQTSDSVELTSVVHHTSETCAQYLAFGVGLVHLDAPLGTRKLLHAPVTPNR